MKSPDAQTRRIPIALLTLATLFISLTPVVPATRDKKQSEVAATPSPDTIKMRAKKHTASCR